MTRYLLQPVTGKSHLPREHMNSLGPPLLGDQTCPVMTTEPSLEALDYSQPLQLLASSLEFDDSVTG